MIRGSSICKNCEYFNDEIERITAAYEAALERFIAARRALESYGEEQRFTDYMNQLPGFGADGYDQFQNNGREFMGLGPVYADRPYKEESDSRTVQCELISLSAPRVAISFRDVVPEIEAELPRTIDVVFSAMISTGALREFRESGRPYIFITECGLWSIKDWPKKSDGTNNYDIGENGLLAGYRIVPPDQSNWDMTVAENREILKRNILRVGTNQVVQVIWKIQLGSLSQLGTLKEED